MTLVWTRVDQKLIHGQVSVAWVPYLGADAIVVTDYDTCDDLWGQEVMAMGVPPEVRDTYFTSPPLLAGLLASDELKSRRVMVIFSNLEGVLEAAEAGFVLDTLNLGNQCSDGQPDTIRLAESFYVNCQDMIGLTRLHMAGLEIILQAVPAGKAVKWRPTK